MTQNEIAFCNKWTVKLSSTKLFNKFKIIDIMSLYMMEVKEGIQVLIKNLLI